MKIGLHRIVCGRCTIITSHTVERDIYVGDLYKQCVPCGKLEWIDENGTPTQDLEALAVEAETQRTGWTTGRYKNSSKNAVNIGAGD